MRKYRNKPITVDNVRFDSQREYARWCELLLLQRAGKITDLERQVTYVLAPSVKFCDSQRAKPPLRIKPDFRYRENGELICEDLKSDASLEDRAFTIRRHLLLSVHGVQLRITK